MIKNIVIFAVVLFGVSVVDFAFFLATGIEYTTTHPYSKIPYVGGIVVFIASRTEPDCSK